MNRDILFFFGERMCALPICERLEGQIPDVKMKVAKISFANKRSFAFVSFQPCRKVKGLTVTFGLGPSDIQNAS